MLLIQAFDIFFNFYHLAIVQFCLYIKYLVARLDIYRCCGSYDYSLRSVDIIRSKSRIFHCLDQKFTINSFLQ